MPLGANKVALYGAAGIKGNYFGNGSLGNCTFGASSITQTSDTVAIDTVLATGSEAGGPGSSSYGDVLNPSACYEFTVLNKSGSYDGDMLVANFKDLTINASVTLTTDQPGRGILVYVDGDCTINGALSMSARGGFSNPTASGGSDSSAVSATGIRLPILTASGTDTLSAADFAGAGNAAVASAANQPGIAGNGTIFTINRDGTAGGVHGGSSPSAGATGAKTISTGGGGSGGNAGSGTPGTGAIAGVFGGGSGGGGSSGESAGDNAVAYGGAGGNGNGSSYSANGGAGNPGGTASGGSHPRNGGNGTGGLIILLVSGNLTIASGGYIQSIGQNGGYRNGSSDGTGGGSGGGAFFGLYSGSFSNSGTISMAGGVNNNVQGAQNGAAGGHHQAQILE